MIQLGKMRVDKVPMLVTPVSDYDILISMDDLIRLGAVIDCQKNSIYFFKYKVRVICDGTSRESRSAMTKPQEVPDFLAMFPEVFVKGVPKCNMCTCSDNGTPKQAVQDLPCLVHLYLVYLI